MFLSADRTHLRAFAIFVVALTCVRSADLNMAAYNRPLSNWLAAKFKLVKKLRMFKVGEKLHVPTLVIKDYVY